MADSSSPTKTRRRRGRRGAGAESQVERARKAAERDSPEPARSLAQAAMRYEPPPPRPARWPWLLSLLAAVVATLAAVFLAGPLAPFAPWWHPAAAAAVGIGAVAGAWRWRSRVAPRTAKVSGLSAAVLVAVFAVGASTQVVIGGTPHLVTSETAQAYRLVLDIERDLESLARHDELIAADQTTARSNIAAYGPAAQEMARIRARYVDMTVEDLPNEVFLPIVQSVATAADFGGRALESREDLALQYDSRLETTMISYRSTYAEQVLTAGQQLSGVAGLYDIDMSTTRPVE